LSTLDAQLSTDPTLHSWASYSATEKAQIERAIAWEQWLAKTYSGESATTFTASLDGTVTKAGSDFETAVSADELAIDTGAGALVDTGASVAAIGGEVADAGIAAGSLAAPAALVPILGITAYEDITTGTNHIYSQLYSTPPDHEATVGVAAESLSWIQFSHMNHDCSISFALCMRSYEAEHSSCSGSELPQSIWTVENTLIVSNCSPTEATNRFGEPASTPRQTVPFGSSEPMGGLEIALHSLYFLDEKVEGIWYLGSSSHRIEGPPEVEGKLTESKLGWTDAESACFAAFGSPDFIGATGTTEVLGYPPTIGTFLIVKDAESPSRCFYSKGESPRDDYEGETIVVRDGNTFHRGLPKHMTKAEIEAAEAGGHTFTHGKGDATLGPVGVTAPLKKAEEEGKHVPLHKALKHWYEAGPEGKEPSEEPLPGVGTIPDCTGRTGEECVLLVEAAGFPDVELEPLTWETAVVTIEPEHVVETSPAGGSKVETSTKVNVIENPSEEDMPVFLPLHLPGGHETGEDYKKRIEEEGWTDNELKTLPESREDPSVGPNGMSYTDPGHGTREDPSKKSSTKVTIEQNPETAPAPEGHVPIGGPTLPGIKFPNFGVLCKGFPFGVPCWLAKTIEGWSATGKAPEWKLELNIKGKEINFTFDLAKLEPIMSKVRIALVILSTIGLVLLFYNFAKGGSPPSGSGTGDDNPMGYGEPGGPGAEQEFS
jgi:hypothetical protein